MSQPIDISPQAKKTVKELLQRYLPGVTVWAYGSRVKWTARPDSDLDLVVFATPEQRSHVANLREAFEESNLPFRVDVFIWDEVPEKFREEIREGYVVVQGEEREQRGDTENFQTTTFNKLIAAGILEIGDGYRAKNSELGGNGPIFLRAGHVTDTHINFDDAERFHPELEVRVRPKMAKFGDTILTTKGNSTGRTSFVTEGMPLFVYSPHLSYWRTLAPERLSSGFLRYWSQGQEFVRQLAGMATSTDMAPYLSLTDQRRLQITVPPPKHQRCITEILGSLDDKIEFNRRMNQTLEATAQAIFKSWFVDFDPVKAKQAALALGRDPKRAAMASLSGKLCVPKNPADLSVEDLVKAEAKLDQLGKEERKQLEQTAALFPDGFVDSELGLIPEGWEVEQIAKHLDVVRGLSYKGAGLSEVGIPLHNLNSIHEGGGYKYEGIKFYSLDYKEKHIALPGDVLVANTEQGFDHLLIGFGAIVPKYFKKGVFSHHIFRVRPRPSSPLSNYFILHLFLPGSFQRWVVGFTNGTTVNMLPIDGLTKPLLAIPTRNLIERFTNVVFPMYDQTEANVLQSQDLADLRDTLLPKLLSGKLSLCEVEAQTENALS